MPLALLRRFRPSRLRISSTYFGDSDDGVSEEDLEVLRELVIFGLRSDVQDKRYNVLTGDFSRLPSAFIGAAEYDPLLDDSLDLKRHMDTAGVSSQLQIYSGVLHGFSCTMVVFSTKLARH